MIIIQQGFDINLENSAGLYININSGTLKDTNSGLVYSLYNKKFKKTINSKKYVYFDVEKNEFYFSNIELSPLDLDTTHDKLCPLAYIEINEQGILSLYSKLFYGEINITPEEITSEDLTAFKPIKFITEKNLPVIGTTVTVSKKIYHIFNLFIYDQGDVILGTLNYEDTTITLAEDVSPALCEVTYGYIVT